MVAGEVNGSSPTFQGTTGVLKADTHSEYTFPWKQSKQWPNLKSVLPADLGNPGLGTEEAVFLPAL